MSKLHVLKPRLSEKAYGMSQVGSTYVFAVPGDANKLSVASAVADQFEVTVTKVNIMNVKGKAKRTFMNRRGKFVNGVRSDTKKAYVTIKSGQNIPIFAAEEEAEAKQEKTAETLKKAVTKASEKAEKKAKKEKK